MTIARFSEDHDAKWIIGLVALSVILAIGWLTSVGGSKSEEPKSEATAAHAP